MFVPEAALIGLREGLEALLIVGILLGLVTKLGRPDARKHVWIGFGLAAAASVGAGWVVQSFLLAAFEENGGAEVFEVVAAGVAIVVLTYMVIWMWKHTRALLGTVQRDVQALLTRGALVGIAILTFASVVREGLEVVLFFGALSSRATPLDLAWSGAVGFFASAAIVVALLKGTVRLDLTRFFAVTGGILIFVAAGLLVHSVGAATELGILPEAPAIWDTSGVLADDSAVGRVSHALVGYTATPTLLQALLYFGYVFGVGNWYLWSLGVFHRRTESGMVVRRAAVAVGVIAVVLVAGAIASGAADPEPFTPAHSHDDGSDHTHDPTASSTRAGADPFVDPLPRPWSS